MVADRDVNLIIRAKNEATQALLSVADALKLITAGQEKVGQSANKTEGIIGQLVTELAALKAQGEGLKVFGTIATQMDKAAGAIGRIGTEVDRTVSDLARLSTEFQNAGAKTDRLKTQTREAAEAIERHKAALKAAKADQRDATAEVTRATSALEKYKAVAAKTSPELQSSRKLADLRAQVLGGVATAQQAQQTAAAKVIEETKALEAAKRAAGEFAGALKSAAEQEFKLSVALERTTGAVATQNERMTGAKQAFGEIKAVADQASAAMGGVAATEKAVADAAVRAAVELDRVSAALRRQQAGAKGGTLVPATVIDPKAILGSVSAGGDAAAKARQDFQAQAKAVQEAKVAMEQAQAAATALGRAMATTDNVTAELAREFLLAKAAAAEATREYLAQSTALAKTRQEVSATFEAFTRATNARKSALAAETAANQQAAASARDLARDEARIANAAAIAAAREHEAAAAALELASANSRAAASSNELYGLFGRIRTQTLSLIAAYIGLQAAIQGIGRIIETFKTIEAVQSRLGVVFSQNTKAITQEIAFLNAEAARLGISFQILGDEYSKLAVAAKVSNITSETTRKLFIAVAEAARVNKLSMEDTSGIFLAFTQMMQKGKVQSEEVVKQLGNRVPGALKLMSESLGLTTAEFLKLMKSGELLANDEFFQKVTVQFNKAFGPQLEASLKTTTTAIGQFQTEVFNTFARIGEGGFIDAFTEGLRKITAYFKSREGRDFFLAIGEALGNVTRALIFLLPWFNQLRTIFVVLIAMRFAGVITGIGTAIAAVAGRVVAFSRAIEAAQGVLATTGTVAKGLFSVLGGIPGIIAAIGGIIVSQWIFNVDKATSAVDEHHRQMEALQAQYVKTAHASAEWAKTVEGITFNQAQKSAEDLKKVFEDARKAVEKPETTSTLNLITDRAAAFPDQLDAGLARNVQLIQQLKDVQAEFIRAGTSVEEYKRRLQEISDLSTDDKVKAFATDMQNSADTAKDAQKQWEESEAKLALLNGTATEAQKILLGMADATKETVDSTEKAAEAWDAYEKALNKLKEEVPSLAVEMKKLKESAKVEDAFKTAFEAISKMANLTKQDIDRLQRSVTSLRDAALQGIDVSDITKGLEGLNGAAAKAAKLIADFEGMQPTAKFDVNKFRLGFGSETMTSESGKVRDVEAGDVEDVKGAVRDLTRRVIKYFDDISKQVGPEIFNKLNDTQKGVLASIAHNYGTLPDRIITALKGGNVDEIGKAIAALGEDNPEQGFPNRKRRRQEAAIFTGSDDTKDIDVALKKQRELLDNQKEAKDRLNESIELRNSELEGMKESTREGEIQKEIEKQRIALRKVGLELQDEDIKKIRESVGAKFDAKHADQQANDDHKKQIAEIVGLDQQRANLQREFFLAQKQGNTTAMEETRAKIDAINTKLADLIPKALEMARALGDQKMIATLEHAATNADVLGQKLLTAASNTNFLGLNMDQMRSIADSFAGGLAGAFGTFFQLLGEGKSAVDAMKTAFLQFASQFLIQIGQMILKQAILNALQAFMPGFFGLGHAGGTVGQRLIGSGNPVRRLTPAAFAGAMRFQNGGLPGLRPGEVPAILHKNEEVLKGSDPRNVLNGGKADKGEPGQGQKMDLKIVNLIDSGEFISQGLGTAPGQQAFMNFIRANRTAVKAQLG